LKTANKLRRGEQESQLVLVLESFLALAEENSVNCWEAVFYRSVLGAEELINHLREGELPENL
jgi:hypothetical protein